MSRGEWCEVTPGRPCPVCGRDGWCAVSRDGTVAVCRRVPDGGRARVDRAGVLYFVHRLRGGEPVPVGVILARRVAMLTGEVPEPAPPEVRDEVYRAVLARLVLNAVHRDALLRRGLPPEEIARRGYGSLPADACARWTVAGDLADRFGLEVLLGVPGFVRRTSRRTGRVYVTVAGAPGLLIPCRDVAGRIVALLLRPDVAPRSGAKYLWLTSTSAGGPGPGTPAHVPLAVPGAPEARGGTVSIYEGILKSDISAALDPARLPAVGIPGHGGWRAAMPILRALAPRTVRYFPDPDAWHKPEVGASLRAFWRALQTEGFSAELARFDDVET